MWGCWAPRGEYSVPGTAKLPLHAPASPPAAHFLAMLRSGRRRVALHRCGGSLHTPCLAPLSRSLERQSSTDAEPRLQPSPSRTDAKTPSGLQAIQAQLFRLWTTCGGAVPASAGAALMIVSTRPQLPPTAASRVRTGPRGFSRQATARGKAPLLFRPRHLHWRSCSAMLKSRRRRHRARQAPERTRLRPCPRPGRGRA